MTLSSRLVISIKLISTLRLERESTSRYQWNTSIIVVITNFWRLVFKLIPHKVCKYKKYPYFISQDVPHIVIKSQINQKLVLYSIKLLSSFFVNPDQSKQIRSHFCPTKLTPPPFNAECIFLILTQAKFVMKE